MSQFCIFTQYQPMLWSFLLSVFDTVVFVLFYLRDSYLYVWKRTILFCTLSIWGCRTTRQDSHARLATSQFSFRLTVVGCPVTAVKLPQSLNCFCTFYRSSLLNTSTVDELANCQDSIIQFLILYIFSYFCHVCYVLSLCTIRLHLPENSYE